MDGHSRHHRHHPPPDRLVIAAVSSGSSSDGGAGPEVAAVLAPDEKPLRHPQRPRGGGYGAIARPGGEGGGGGGGEGLAGPEGEGLDGARAIEAVTSTWSRWGLVFAYLGIFLMAFTTSLEGQTTYNLTPFATSSFSTHSLISTVYVVQGVVNAVIKPPMAKIADVFGRLEAFSLSVLLYVLGYVQQALSRNVETFASAQIFYSAGFTGLQILQQIFIADTSDLLNRALLSSLPNLPFLVTVWAGPVLANAVLAAASWRWGYGMWAAILPVMFLPLACSLSLNVRRARRSGLLLARPPSRRPAAGRLAQARKLCLDLDLVGLLLLSAAFSLILIPLTLASRVPGGWANGGIVAMLVAGFVFLVGYPVWEATPSLAPQPVMPLYLLRSRTFCAGCGVGFLFFVVFYLSVQPYFYSYLLVVQDQSVSAAGHITQTFSFTATVSAVAVSLVIKYVGRYKPVICTGAVVYAAGIGLMIRYRTRDASVLQLVATQAALGVGAGMMNVPTQLGIQAAAAAAAGAGAGRGRHVAAATAVFHTLAEMGGAVGSAVSGAVWGRLVPRKLARYLPAAARGRAADIYASVVVARSYPPGSPERDAIDRAYQETMTRLLTIAAAVCLPVIALSFLMADYRLDEMARAPGRRGGDRDRDDDDGDERDGHGGGGGGVGEEEDVEAEAEAEAEADRGRRRWSLRTLFSRGDD